MAQEVEPLMWRAAGETVNRIYVSLEVVLRRQDLPADRPEFYLGEQTTIGGVLGPWSRQCQVLPLRVQAQGAIEALDDVNHAGAGCHYPFLLATPAQPPGEGQGEDLLAHRHMERLTAFAVVPGALVGAIPPAIGWASGRSPTSGCSSSSSPPTTSAPACPPSPGASPPASSGGWVSCGSPH